MNPLLPEGHKVQGFGAWVKGFGERKRECTTRNVLDRTAHTCHADETSTGRCREHQSPLYVWAVLNSPDKSKLETTGWVGWDTEN